MGIFWLSRAEKRLLRTGHIAGVNTPNGPLVIGDRVTYATDAGSAGEGTVVGFRQDGNRLLTKVAADEPETLKFGDRWTYPPSTKISGWHNALLREGVPITALDWA